MGEPARDLGAPSVADLLKKTAKATPAKKSSVPELTVPGEIVEKAARLRQVKEEITDKETELDLLQAEVLAAIEPMRTEILQREYVSSVKLQTPSGIVMFSWSARYSPVSPELEDALRGVVGDEYDGLFSLVNEIKVKDLPESELTELIQAVGYDRFSRWFDVKQAIKPTPRYTEEFHRLPEGTRRELEPIVRQYKPALKTR